MNTTKSTFKPGEIIDIHVHLGGPPGENNRMYYWSEKFTSSPSFEAIKMVTRLNKSTVSGPRYVSVLLQQIIESKYVDKIVLLGLDEVYREDGQRQVEHSHLFVANEYLAHLTRIYPHFLFGCSVHPYSPQALTRLWECAQGGAVLCKWLPSSQAIDPTHPLSQKFYRALAELDLPLLLHVGPEGAIPRGGISLADENLFNAAMGHFGSTPGDGIKMALEAGVRVIVAHAATPLNSLMGLNTNYWESVFEKLLARLEAVEANSSLYADISAFCLPGRYKYVQQILPLVQELPHKFCYGSDFPVPIISFKGKALKQLLDAFGWLAERALPHNDFDKNYKLLNAHFPEAVFRNAVNILRHPQKPVPDLKKYLRRVGEGGVGRKWFLWGKQMRQMFGREKVKLAG